jgi:uncharacterized membrane protein
MQDNQFSVTDSLNLIDSMLTRAKAEERDNGLGWIIWGWVLFVASIAHYVLIKLESPYRHYVWNVFGIIALLLLVYEFIFKRWLLQKSAAVKMYTNTLVSKLGIAFFISLIIISYANAVTGQNNTGLNFGYLLILYAFWMFIFGAAYRFKLFYYGAAINWIGAIIIFYFRTQLDAGILLVHGACVALGYLLPGHLAYVKFSKSQQEKPHV